MRNKPQQQKIHKPTPSVAAGAGGAIRVPEPMDVLSGRGGAVNSHVGNKRYRELVNLMKAEYLRDTTRKNEKTRIAASIVWTIRNANSPGRFLKQDPDTNLWYEIGDKVAFRKTGQALRENSAEFIRSWDGKVASNRIGLAVVHHYIPQNTCINPQLSSLSALDEILRSSFNLGRGKLPQQESDWLSNIIMIHSRRTTVQSAPL